MNAINKTLAEITDEAINVLCREIGVIETIRFLHQFGFGYGDYTKERQNNNDNRTVAEIVAEVKKRREQSSKKSISSQEVTV